jgi:hypothetical protein
MNMSHDTPESLKDEHISLILQAQDFDYTGLALICRVRELEARIPALVSPHAEGMGT